MVRTGNIKKQDLMSLRYLLVMYIKTLVGADPTPTICFRELCKVCHHQILESHRDSRKRRSHLLLEVLKVRLFFYTISGGSHQLDVAHV